MSTETDTQTESQADIERVIARIQKLLSRTKEGSGTSEAEADTAMKMAQELMLKHNLDMAEVEAAGASKGANVAAERVKDEVKGRAMYTWQRQLAKYVAEANFCYHLVKRESEWVDTYYKLKPNAAGIDSAGKELPKTMPREQFYQVTDEEVEWQYTRVEGRYKTSHKHLFVGRKANVITAQLMYQYLTQTIEDLVPITDNSQRLSRSAMSWKEGCADRLCERLFKRREDLIKAHDARIRQQEEDRKAEVAQRAEAARKATSSKPRQLGADHATEVQAHFNMAAAGAYDLSGDKPEAEEVERPDVDPSDDYTPGQSAEEVTEPDPGVALVLASVYDETEREANWELAHGYEPGTLARHRAAREERERKEAEERAKQQVEEVERPVKEETERQRKAREAREAKEYAKQRTRWDREALRDQRRAEREWAKKDHRAYYAGARKGDDIGLDTQIARNTDSTKKLK